jgi:phage gpG-like protein
VIITGRIVGDKAVQAALQRRAADTESAIRAAVLRLSFNLQRNVRTNKLSGTPLKRVTGDLSRSIYVTTEDNGFTGVVGANVPYAARQEYGFQGIESVREYVRRSRAQMATAKFNKLGNETRPSKAKGKGAGVIIVHAHSRQVNYPAHSYLRSALSEMRGEITAQLTAAMRKALQ